MYIVGFWNKRNWLTAPVTVSFSLYDWSFLLWSLIIWYKVMSSTCYISSSLFLLHFLQSSSYKFYVYFRNLCYTSMTRTSSLSRSGKLTCEKCGTLSVINIVRRHKRRCSTETLHFTQCSNFSTTSQTYLSLLL